MEFISKAFATTALIVIGALAFANHQKISICIRNWYASAIRFINGRSDPPRPAVGGADNKEEIPESTEELEAKATRAREVMNEEMKKLVTPVTKEPFTGKVETGEKPISREQTRRVVLEALMTYSSRARKA